MAAKIILYLVSIVCHEFICKKKWMNNNFKFVYFTWRWHEVEKLCKTNLKLLFIHFFLQINHPLHLAIFSNIRMRIVIGILSSKVDFPSGIYSPIRSILWDQNSLYKNTSNQQKEFLTWNTEMIISSFKPLALFCDGLTDCTSCWATSFGTPSAWSSGRKRRSYIDVNQIR